MKNKKKKQTKTKPLKFILGSIQIIILIVGILILGTILFHTIIDKPEFKITQKGECHEEVISEGNRTQRITSLQGDITLLCEGVYSDGHCQTFFEPVKITPIRLYEEWDCSEYSVWWEGDIKKEERSERTCYRNLSLDSIEIDGMHVLQKEHRDFNVFLEFNYAETWNEAYCDWEEVDEINIHCFNSFMEVINCDEIPKENPFYVKEVYKKMGYRDRVTNTFSGLETLRDIEYFGEDKNGNSEYENYLIQLIKKEELSIEWLENNCKCSLCINQEGSPSYPEYAYLCGKDFNPEENVKINLGGDKCFEYQYGEYKVEII